MKIAPHDAFTYTTADEVAECMEVGDQLYGKLWNEIVPKMAPLRASEYPDSIPDDVLSRFWTCFTADEQRALNAAAAAQEAEWSEVRLNAMENGI